MKKIIAFVLAAPVFIGINSCQKTKSEVNKATEFDMSYSSEFTIPSTTLTLPTGTTQPIDFTTPDISTASASRFTSESTTQDLIDEIKMTKFNLSNPGSNLNFLKSISIYFKTSNLGDILVATKSNIPQNVSSVDADLLDVNIKEYIFKDKIQVRVSATIITGPGSTSDQKLKIAQTVHVKGKRV